MPLSYEQCCALKAAGFPQVVNGLSLSVAYNTFHPEWGVKVGMISLNGAAAATDCPLDAHEVRCPNSDELLADLVTLGCRPSLCKFNAHDDVPEHWEATGYTKESECPKCGHTSWPSVSREGATPVEALQQLRIALAAQDTGGGAHE